MHVDITGRHIEVTPALKEFTEDRLRKLEKLLDGPLEVHVVLGIEKHRHTAEIQVKTRNAVLSGTHETSDLYASIREVAEKLERQALKHKERTHQHKQRKGPRVPAVAAVIEANASPETRAEAESPAEPAPAIGSRRFRVKPLSLDDAVLELDETGDDLLVYREADSDRVKVLYRRKDGTIELVEPEF